MKPTRRTYAPVMLLIAHLALAACGAAQQEEESAPAGPTLPPRPEFKADPKRADPTPRSTPTAPGAFTLDPKAVLHDPATVDAPAAYTRGDDAVTGDVVLVAFDGFTTCLPPEGPAESGLAGLTTRLATALRTASAREPAVFSGCFGIDNDSVRVTTTGDDQKIAIVKLTDLTAKLSAFLAARANPKVYFVGHSYGGWTVMKLASGFTGKGVVRGVALLDAISNTACTPPAFVKASLGQDGGAGCQAAPSDFSAAELARLAEVPAAERRNFYQLEKPLHSGPLAGWTNVLVSTGLAGVDSHTALEDHPASWDAIEDGIAADAATLPR